MDDFLASILHNPSLDLFKTFLQSTNACERKFKSFRWIGFSFSWWEIPSQAFSGCCRSKKLRGFCSTLFTNSCRNITYNSEISNILIVFNHNRNIPYRYEFVRIFMYFAFYV